MKDTFAAAVLAAALIMTCSCLEKAESPTGNATGDIVLDVSSMEGDITTRAADPDEDRILDVNLFVFDSRGMMEVHKYMEGDALQGTGACCSLTLAIGREYGFYAVANTGFNMNIRTLEELKGYRYHFVYPDDYSTGIPMTGYTSGAITGDGCKIRIDMKRVMAKVSLRMDRSALDPDVRIIVNSIKAGACPRSVLLWGDSRAEDSYGIFPSGFSRSGSEVDPLNRINTSQVSDWVDLYVLENLQGSLLPHDTPDNQRYFGEADSRGRLCSWIELSADYVSERFRTSLDSPLLYRFYLGEGGSFDVSRNTHYLYTVRPVGDGISENSWRLDKHGLAQNGREGWMTVYPGNYIEGKLGDRIHIWCDWAPSYARFDVGMEELDFDKERGIYDYETDQDGKGVWITLKKKGTGLLYFSVGPPVDDAAIIIVVCEP